jgi:multidrug efflux pump
MSRYFINHPVFAWVIAIMIVIAGVLAIRGLGVESYPNIAPPQVGVFANYPGANAETVERAVTQIIEQQLTGIDNLDYFSASSGSDGSASLNLTFKPGTDPDIAQMQVQNKCRRPRRACPATWCSRAWWCRRRTAASSWSSR